MGKMLNRRNLLMAAVLMTLQGTAAAVDLTIGRATEQSSLDPQFSRTGNNHASAQDIFDSLVETDAHLQIKPSLAVSWQNIDPLTWEIKLRPGVKFQDGSDFTAKDVVFSMERVKQVKNSPAPFTGYLQTVESFTVTDPLTLRVKTRVPNPGLIEDLGQIYIVSAQAAAGASQADFNSGKAVIGTGPYRFVRWLPNDRLVMAANPNWWGGKPAFDNVTVRFIANNAARVSAFLAGSVDIIDEVPASDLVNLRQKKEVNIYSIDSGRLIYLGLNQRSGPAPFITDTAGKALATNPLQLQAVRQAISTMIDRNAIVNRLLKGEGTPSAQVVPAGLGGFDPELKPAAADPAAARALLAKAGFDHGFGITLHSSNDRFAGDNALAQALGQMLARGGLKVNAVSTLPYNVYTGAATRGDYSLYLFSIGTSRSNSGSNLKSLLQTYDADKGTGNFNRMRYSNPAFDALLDRALVEFDLQKRDALLREATRLVMNDYAVIPLYIQKVSWAAHKGYTFRANMSEFTTAREAGVAQ